MKSSPMSRYSTFKMAAFCAALTLPSLCQAQFVGDLPDPTDNPDSAPDLGEILDGGDVELTDGDTTFDDSGSLETFLPGDFIYEDGIFYALASPSIPAFDFSAVESLVSSGLPTASALRQIQYSATRSALRDVAGRIFRHRAGLGPLMEENEATANTVSLTKDGKATLPTMVSISSLQHWEMFASGNFGQTDLDRINSQAGFNGDAWSGTVGAEYHFTKNLTLGGAFTYGSSDYTYSEDLGRIHLASPTGSVYASYAEPACYVDLLYSYGTSDVAVHRHGQFSQGDYEGSTDSSQHYGELNAGYNLILLSGHLLTGPTLAANYLNGQTDAYRERNTGAAALAYDGQDYQSLISQVGWQLSVPTRVGACSIVPQLHGAWAHEYLDEEDDIQATLQTSPFIAGAADSFRATQKTSRPGRDYLAAGAGVAVNLGENWSIDLDYEGEFLRNNGSSHLATVRAGFHF